MLHPILVHRRDRPRPRRLQPISIAAAALFAALTASFVLHEQLRASPDKLRADGTFALNLANSVGDTVAEFSQAVIYKDPTSAQGAAQRLVNLMRSAQHMKLIAQLSPLQLRTLEQSPLSYADRRRLDVLRVQTSGVQRALLRYGYDHLKLASEQNRAIDHMFRGAMIVLMLFAVASMVLLRRAPAQRKRELDEGINEGARDSLAEALLDHTRDSVCYADCDGYIQHVNAVYCRISGFSAAEVVGQHIDFNLASSPSGEQSSGSLAMENLLEHGSWRGDLWRRTRDGELYVEQTRRLLLRDDDGLVTGLLAVASDPGMTRDTERLLLWQATHDPLTKLPNRSLFLERISQLTQGLGDGAQGSVMLLDIDRFKSVNDGLGHSVGDQLLIDATYRLAMAVRDNDTLARVNGDQFGIIAVSPASVAEAERIARNVMSQFAEPFTVSGRDIYLSISVGIAMYPGDGQNVELLLQSAESALKQVEQHGRNGYHFFEVAMNTAAARRLDIEHGLRKAVTLGELALVYQPIIDASEQEVASVEALIRWNHPEWGTVLPGEFISVAEESGLIDPIGLWVIESVKQQIEAWQTAGIEQARVAINVSGRQLLTAERRRAVLDALSGKYANQLTLEITETVLLDDDDAVLDFLTEARELGVQIALDDFGTGFSSLSYLRRYPIDILKIDKSFVDHMEHGSEDLALVATIASMGRTLGMRVVAEGVERASQARALIDLGCGYLQGFYYGRPMPGDTMADMLARSDALRRTKAAAG